MKNTIALVLFLISSIAYGSESIQEGEKLGIRDYTDYKLNVITNHQVTIEIKGEGKGNIDCGLIGKDKLVASDINNSNECYIQFIPEYKNYYLRVRNNGNDVVKYTVVVRSSDLLNI
jgi:hypothetical protein